MAKQKKLPFFSFYPSDFDSDTQLLCDAEVGAYVRLMNIQWKNGMIPESKLPRLMEDYDNVWPEIKQYFTIKNGLVYNERLERERDIAKKRHEKAVKANNARWNAKGNAPSNTTSNTPKNPNSELITHNTEHKPHKKRKRFTPPLFTDVLKRMTDTSLKNHISQSSGEIEAERFINFYTSNGWKVGKNKMVSWESAVANWLSRLEPEAKIDDIDWGD